MRAIERVVVEPAVLTPEEQRHGSVGRHARELRGGRARIDDGALGGAMAGGEAGHACTSGKRVIERRLVPDALDDVARAVRDHFDPAGIVVRRVHEPEVVHAHVLHRAHHGSDVDRIPRLVQDDARGVERALSHRSRRMGAADRGTAGRREGIRTRRARRSGRVGRGDARDPGPCR